MTSLEKNVFKVVLRCTTRVCHGFDAKNILVLAESISDQVVKAVIVSDPEVYFELRTDRAETWCLMNAVLDEVAKEIPATARIELVGVGILRSHQVAYLKNMEERKQKRYATATTDGGNRGDTQDLAC